MHNVKAVFSADSLGLTVFPGCSVGSIAVQEIAAFEYHRLVEYEGVIDDLPK